MVVTDVLGDVWVLVTQRRRRLMLTAASDHPTALGEIEKNGQRKEVERLVNDVELDIYVQLGPRTRQITSHIITYKY
jgi:hypothetical protein